MVFFGLPLVSVDFSSNIDFKLKELAIGFLNVWKYESLSPLPMKNINLFLKTQKDSLEKLTVNAWENAEVIKTILSMPRLKYLTLRVLVFTMPLVMATEIFPQSNSIKYLNH